MCNYKKCRIYGSDAARGHDIFNIALVVNFVMPKQLDNYVHRIGRTGRAGRKGVAIAFANEHCTYLAELGHLVVEAKQDLPSWFGDLCYQAARKPKHPTEIRDGRTDLPYVTKRIPTHVQNPAPAWGQSGAEDAW